jgi:hypothetical protein
MKLDLAVECHVPAVRAKAAELFPNLGEHPLDQDHRFTMSSLSKADADV